MRREKLSQRISIESLYKGDSDDPNGRIFVNDLGIHDLSNIEIVGSFVDTYRQLFSGVCKQHVIDKLDAFLSLKEQTIVLREDKYPFAKPEIWHLSKIGKTSGFRYKLQSNSKGIVILFCSYYAKPETYYSHLKMELSPQLINSTSMEQLWHYLYKFENSLAKFFLDDIKPSGVAVHLAVDVQNWEQPGDFLNRFLTYSRTFKAYDGIGEIDLSDLSEAVVSYGSGKTQAKNYLIGKHQSTQLCIYDKSYEIKKSDKVDYFYHEWGVYSLGVFDPKKTVRRIELRLHHTVVKEAGLSIDTEFLSMVDIQPFLTSLWRYALSRNKLLTEDSKYLDPFWQLLMQDVRFSAPAKSITRRQKKTSTDPIAHNIGALIGNLISISARQGFNVGQVMSQIRFMTIYPQIMSYYRSRGLNEEDLRQHVEKALLLRRLIGKAS